MQAWLANRADLPISIRGLAISQSPRQQNGFRPAHGAHGALSAIRVAGSGSQSALHRIEQKPALIQKAQGEFRILRGLAGATLFKIVQNGKHAPQGRAPFPGQARGVIKRFFPVQEADNPALFLNDLPQEFMNGKFQADDGIRVAGDQKAELFKQKFLKQQHGLVLPPKPRFYKLIHGAFSGLFGGIGKRLQTLPFPREKQEICR
jgi:hypothetical protein